MDRKTFLEYTGAGFMLVPSAITSCMNAGTNDSDIYRYPLQLPDTLDSDQLRASRDNLTLAEQYTLDALQFNGSLPGPTVRIKRGERFPSFPLHLAGLWHAPCSHKITFFEGGLPSSADDWVCRLLSEQG